MKSNIYLFKELKGTEVKVKYNKEEFTGIFEDFDLDGKFVFIRVDGKLRVIWWPGSKRFEMVFADPEEPVDDEENPTGVPPEVIYDDYMRD